MMKINYLGYERQGAELQKLGNRRTAGVSQSSTGQTR